MYHACNVHFWYADACTLTQPKNPKTHFMLHKYTYNLQHGLVIVITYSNFKRMDAFIFSKKVSDLISYIILSHHYTLSILCFFLDNAEKDDQGKKLVNATTTQKTSGGPS